PHVEEMLSPSILGGVHNSLIMNVARLREESIYVARKFLCGTTRRIFQGGNFLLLVLRAPMFVEELRGRNFVFESALLREVGCKDSQSINRREEIHLELFTSFLPSLLLLLTYSIFKVSFLPSSTSFKGSNLRSNSDEQLMNLIAFWEFYAFIVEERKLYFLPRYGYRFVGET
ncbi:hypothetical protein L195_g041455, partial [Trifolium pratense]